MLKLFRFIFLKNSVTKDKGKNIICVIQARVGSTRFPGKIFADIFGLPMLSRVINRLKESKQIDGIAVAIPGSPPNNEIEDFLKERHSDVRIIRGSENDVLSRYLKAARELKADAVVRITSDCPLIDGEVVDRVVSKFLSGDFDYAANILGKRTFPRGMDVEVISLVTLEKLDKLAVLDEDREHVTLFLRKNPQRFKTTNVENEKDLSHYRMTVDEQADIDLVREIFKHFDGEKDFSFYDVAKFLEENPNVSKINSGVGQKLSKY